MQSFAVSANGSKCFLLDQKVHLSHFSNAKYVETQFVKIKEYTHKKKKVVHLRTNLPHLFSFPPLFTRTQHYGTVLVKSQTRLIYLWYNTSSRAQ